jgi:hypothetical protein
MEYVYELKDKKAFVGSILIEIPNIKEQFKILKELNIAPSEDGKVKFADQLDTVQKQLDLCEKYIKKVDIKHSSGKEFKSVEDMLYFKQTRELLLNDISGMMINGIDLGK